MPISKENMALYPGGSIRSKEWREIVERIGVRSGWKCETCGIEQHAVILRGSGKRAGTYMTSEAEVFDAETSERFGYFSMSDYPGNAVQIVLTVAHLDHDPENNADENLRHWCQYHHNRHDAPHRRESAAKTRRAHTADLFEGKP